MKNAAIERSISAAAKRMACLVLCLLMLVSLLPVRAYAATTTPSKVTQAQAKKRIAQLQSELDKKYFTVNQKACNTTFVQGHGRNCTNCANSKVIKAAWFKSAVSLVPSAISNCPEGHFYEYAKGQYGGTTASAHSCAGFATFASWYIFAQKASNKVKNEHIITTTYNKSNLSKALPGDLLIFSDKNQRRGWAHAAIFIEATSTGARVLQCNWRASKGNCYVSTDVVRFTKYKYFSISRASNYDTTAHTHTAGTAWQTDADNHWKLCTANDNYVMNKAAHSFTTVVEQEGGLYHLKKSHKECTVCGYQGDTKYSDFQYYKGDVNYDGTVDILDVAGLYDHLSTGAPYPACKNEDINNADTDLHIAWYYTLQTQAGCADITGDGTTDVYDLQYVYETACGLHNLILATFLPSNT